MTAIKLTTTKHPNTQWIMNALDHAFKRVEGVEPVFNENDEGGEEIYLEAQDNRNEVELTALALDTLTHALTRAFTV